MPPDIQGLVRKFIPNHPKLMNVVTKLLQSSFHVKTLPVDLVKIVVKRGFELERDLEVEVESTVFAEKLQSYINQIKPRYMAKLNQIRQQNRKW